MSLEQDLYNHIGEEPKKAHSIFALVKPAIQNALAAMLGALVYDKLTGAYLTNPLIHCGRESAGTTSVTFPVAFKTGTEPKVVLTSMAVSVVIRLNGTPTATGFTVQGKGIDGTTQNQAFEWIAIGKKA